MARCITLFVILILGALLRAGAVSAQSRESLIATGGSHGIRISISLPRRAYPQNALVLATITVTNVGHADRYLPDWPPNWGGSFSPQVRM